MRSYLFPALGLIGLLATVPASAADKAGDYSVRGVGSLKCSVFVDTVVGAKPELGTFIGYIDGVVTTASRLTPGVFDASPFILPGPFSAIVMNICKQVPEQIVDVAVRGALEAVGKVRVTTNSPVVEMTVGQNRMNLRAETLRAVQVKLKALKLLTGEPDGKFGAGTQEALRRYQENNHLAVTSLPDPDTVLALLVRS